MKNYFLYSLKNFWKEYFDSKKYMTNIVFRKYVYKIDDISRKCIKNKILDIYVNSLLWKSKYDTPRFEHPAMIHITLFSKYRIEIFYDYKDSYYNDDFWEQYLWIKYFCDGDVQKAIDTWEWIDEKNQSTWNSNFLKKKYRGLKRRTPIEDQC